MLARRGTAGPPCWPRGGHLCGSEGQCHPAGPGAGLTLIPACTASGRRATPSPPASSLVPLESRKVRAARHMGSGAHPAPHRRRRGRPALPCPRWRGCLKAGPASPSLVVSCLSGGGGEASAEFRSWSLRATAPVPLAGSGSPRACLRKAAVAGKLDAGRVIRDRECPHCDFCSTRPEEPQRSSLVPASPPEEHAAHVPWGGAGGQAHVREQASAPEQTRTALHTPPQPSCLAENVLEELQRQQEGASTSSRRHPQSRGAAWWPGRQSLPSTEASALASRCP